jgi:hypothetical protein
MIVLDSGKPLLFRSCNEDAVAKQGGGSVVVITGDSQNMHYCLRDDSKSGTVSAHGSHSVGGTLIRSRSEKNVVEIPNGNTTVA